MKCDREVTELNISSSLADLCYTRSYTFSHPQKNSPQFLQFTRQRSSHYPNLPHSIPVGASFAPLLVAFLSNKYLILLDFAFSQFPSLFYRRTINGWGYIEMPEDNLRRFTHEVLLV